MVTHENDEEAEGIGRWVKWEGVKFAKHQK